MKYIVAFVKPFKVGDIAAALEEIGVRRLSISEVKGYGRQRGHTEIYKGSEYQVDFVPKSRLEIALDDAEVEPAVAAILEAASTDTIGDGKVFIFNLEDAVRVRTGEHGPDAL